MKHVSRLLLAYGQNQPGPLVMTQTNVLRSLTLGGENDMNSTNSKTRYETEKVKSESE